MSPTAADPRRRDSSVRTGISAPALRDGLLKAAPFLEAAFPSLSADTVRHKLAAPNQHNIASERYTEDVVAKIAHGENNLHIESPVVGIVFPPSLD